MWVGLHSLVLLLSLGFSRATSEIISSPHNHELLSGLQAALETNDKRISVLEESLSKQSAEMTSLKHQLETAEQYKSILPRYAQSSVSFYTYNSKTLGDLHNGTIAFDNVVTNVRNGYNKYIGVFTCSVPGSYFFEWNIYVGGGVGHYVTTELMRKGVPVSFATAGTTRHLAMAGSSAAVLQLARGDTIWVRISGFTNSNTVVYSKVSNFSGFLI